MPPEAALFSPWSLWKKVFFRFFALYFFLYLTGDNVPLWWNPLVQWLGEHVLHLDTPIKRVFSGSGDTTFHYVQVLGVLLVALAGTAVWSALDRRRHSYDVLLYWLLVLVRYSLATAMIGYGFAKIYKTQFPFPMPFSLLQPLGESSPMGLVWKFMGYSTGYNYFTGVAEALGGVFLFFRRTSTFGALLSISVLVNIVALNFFFDVPVKLYSTHLLLMAVFVALPDLKRLVSFFFLNKPVPAAAAPPELKKKWMQHTRLGLKILVLCFFGDTTIYQGYFRKERIYSGLASSPLYGVFQVDTFVLNGDTLPPLTTDTTRWKQFMVNSERFVATKRMDDAMQPLFVKTDTTTHTLTWTSSNDSTQNSLLRYHLQDRDQLILQGHLLQDSVQIHLRRINLEKLPLLSRGFHWVNEYPYNK